MCYLDKNKILKSLTKEDIIYIVTTLGSRDYREDRDGNLIFQTICHNPPNVSNSYKLYYYLPKDTEKYGMFHCYSGCDENFDLIELVIRTNRVQGKTFSWYKALRYIATLTNKLELTSDAKEEEIVLTTAEDFQWINKIKSLKKNKRGIPKLKPINQNVLDLFCYYPHELWLADHCSQEALNRFNISYYGLQNSIIIPHFDINHNLIGVRQRLLDQQDIENIGKYVPLQINNKFLAHSLGSNLYGIDVAFEAIKAAKKVIIYESEKSVIQNYTYFGDKSYAVATCGSSFTLTQFKILMQLGVEEIQLAYDKEYSCHDSYEAEAYYNKLYNKVKQYLPYCKISLVMDTLELLERKMSPSDKGKDVLLKLLENKIIL